MPLRLPRAALAVLRRYGLRSKPRLLNYYGLNQRLSPVSRPLLLSISRGRRIRSDAKSAKPISGQPSPVSSSSKLDSALPPSKPKSECFQRIVRLSNSDRSLSLVAEDLLATLNEGELLDASACNTLLTSLLHTITHSSKARSADETSAYWDRAVRIIHHSCNASKSLPSDTVLLLLRIATKLAESTDFRVAETVTELLHSHISTVSAHRSAAAVLLASHTRLNQLNQAELMFDFIRNPRFDAVTAAQVLPRSSAGFAPSPLFVSSSRSFSSQSVPSASPEITVPAYQPDGSVWQSLTLAYVRAGDAAGARTSIERLLLAERLNASRDEADDADAEKGKTSLSPPIQRWLISTMKKLCQSDPSDPIMSRLSQALILLRSLRSLQQPRPRSLSALRPLRLTTTFAHSLVQPLLKAVRSCIQAELSGHSQSDATFESRRTDLLKLAADCDEEVHAVGLESGLDRFAHLLENATERTRIGDTLTRKLSMLSASYSQTVSTFHSADGNWDFLRSTPVLQLKSVLASRPLGDSNSSTVLQHWLEHLKLSSCEGKVVAAEALDSIIDSILPPSLQFNQLSAKQLSDTLLTAEHALLAFTSLRSRLDRGTGPSDWAWKHVLSAFVAAKHQTASFTAQQRARSLIHRWHSVSLSRSVFPSTKLAVLNHQSLADMRQLLLQSVDRSFDYPEISERRRQLIQLCDSMFDQVSGLGSASDSKLSTHFAAFSSTPKPTELEFSAAIAAGNTEAALRLAQSDPTLLFSTRIDVVPPTINLHASDQCWPAFQALALLCMRKRGAVRGVLPFLLRDALSAYAARLPVRTRAVVLDDLRNSMFMSLLRLAVRSGRPKHALVWATKWTAEPPSMMPVSPWQTSLPSVKLPTESPAFWRQLLTVHAQANKALLNGADDGTLFATDSATDQKNEEFIQRVQKRLTAASIIL